MLATAPHTMLVSPGRELGLWDVEELDAHGDVVEIGFDILAADEADALLRYSMD